MLGYVKRHSKELNPIAVNNLYTSLIRSHLEYTRKIWSSFQSRHLQN